METLMSSNGHEALADKILSGPPLSGEQLLGKLETRMGSMKLMGARDDLLLDAAVYIQRTKKRLENMEMVVEEAEILLKTNPVFRSMPVGSPHSTARLEQVDKMIAEDNLRAAIAQVRRQP